MIWAQILLGCGYITLACYTADGSGRGRLVPASLYFGAGLAWIVLACL